MENRPCANVFGVRLGPAVWMPASSQRTGVMTAPDCVAALTPKYQLSGLTWVDSGNAGGAGGGSGSVNGVRNESPNACCDCSAG